MIDHPMPLGINCRRVDELPAVGLRRCWLGGERGPQPEPRGDPSQPADGLEDRPLRRRVNRARRRGAEPPADGQGDEDDGDGLAINQHGGLTERGNKRQ